MAHCCRNAPGAGGGHRTLIGHFRHEIGHYYWDLLVMDRCEDSCIATFGNHNN
ncbi:putative zinc-binding metallopeptidase [Microbulbifer halophilus]|uniref:Zinc-binding metallopeptidase n=1 Tax=Microbulbifer halophilus TaxID=453963 RepID=A0ABW5E9T3_9GAMM|nr:putative zinc-binding metallopeptidase [Microbulbifer halophilus]MCW8126429.1 putative zinc-binding metallopeptidase [Microbulbifer halophilus]